MLYEQTRSATGFGMLATERPVVVTPALISHYDKRYEKIQALFSRFLIVLRDALDKKTSPQVLTLLLGDAPQHISIQFHKTIVDIGAATPVFFRTDDPVVGLHCEIQCPGSTWGEYALLEDFYRQRGLYGDSSICSRFASALTSHVPRGDAKIHHLLDNSSMPGTMLYFIQGTRPWLPYFGFDRGLRAKDCNFVRSHSVYGLVAENHFRGRLEAARRGEVVFDLPPNLLFDAKAALALPFWSETSRYFSDEDRSLLCPTVPVLPDGIEMEGTELLSTDAFAELPQNQRGFYLKYAGSDVSCNWGSRAVYRLSNDSREVCRRRLRSAADDFASGRPWVIQKEASEREEVTYVTREGDRRSEQKHTGFRAFLGPGGLLGLMIMYRDHYKVHGQENTVACIADHFGTP